MHVLLTLRVQAFLQAHVTALLHWVGPLIIILFLMLMLFTPQIDSVISSVRTLSALTAFTFELPLQWDMERVDTLQKKHNMCLQAQDACL